MPFVVASRVRRIALIWAAWTAIILVGAASTWLRIQSGEVRPPAGWIWSTLTGIPVWALVTPPIFALSRRFPIERGARAWIAHVGGLAAVMVTDGVVSWLVAAI